MDPEGAATQSPSGPQFHPQSTLPGDGLKVGHSLGVDWNGVNIGLTFSSRKNP